MAFENYPEVDDKNLTTSTSKNSKKSPLVLITGLLVAALLGTWAYVLYDKNKSQEQIAEKETAIVNTTSQRDQLQKELEDATMRYDMLKTEDATKDSMISAKDAEIISKQQEIKRLLTKSGATEAEITQARRLIASLNGDIDVYKNRVEILEAQKMQLVKEKDEITVQRNVALRNYDSASTEIKKKNELIDLGSTLTATNFSILGIDERSKGKETVTSTAKKVDKLRITFDLAENMIAASGSKDIFVIITGPDGSTIAVPALGSGTFTTRDGNSKVYTKKINVNYTQANKKTVSFDWDQNSAFSKGDYKIEVYNNGFKVGDAYKPLKKSSIFG